MAVIVISIILAYVAIGVSYVLKDLNADPIDAPYWTYKPRLGIAIMLMLLWPQRQFEGGFSSGRSIAYGLLGTLCSLSFFAFFAWSCISLSIFISENLLLQIVMSIIFLGVGSIVALPVMSILMIPIMLIVAFPIDILFPPEEPE